MNCVKRLVSNCNEGIKKVLFGLGNAMNRNSIVQQKVFVSLRLVLVSFRCVQLTYYESLAILISHFYASKVASLCRLCLIQQIEFIVTKHIKCLHTVHKPI